MGEPLHTTELGSAGSRVVFCHGLFGQGRNFTAIGDTTNLAARIQTYAEPGNVVIGERTRQLLGSLAQVRALGSPELKGKKEAVPLFELISVSDL